MLDKHLKRSRMDYQDNTLLHTHKSWPSFVKEHTTPADKNRLIGFTTTAEKTYHNFAFRAKDTLVFGSESTGLLPEHTNDCDQLLKIPMRPGKRSLNLAVSVSMVLGFVLGHNKWFS